MDTLKSRIRHIPDFPKPGILFYDITTLLGDPAGFKAAIDALSAPYQGQGISLVIGIESRGFILGAAVADRLGVGLLPDPKAGQAAGGDDQGVVQPRVRHRRDRDPRRRDRRRGSAC